MILALLGFIAAVAAHIAGYLGIDRPFGLNPWPLHVGIFVVWLPAVMVAQRLSKDFPQKEMWKATLRGCPPWMRKVFYVLFAYMFVSFFAFMILQTKSGDDESQVIRGFSGHWILFYYSAYAILYSAINIAKSDVVRRCAKGHPLQPNDRFCNQCGAEVASLIERSS
jgi:hypothetical protein